MDKVFTLSLSKLVKSTKIIQHHSPVRLSRASLSIGEEAGVVSLKGPVKQRLCQAGVDHTLAGILRARLIHRPEAVVVEEPMDDATLGRDDGLIAVHTNHLLGTQTMLSENNR